MFHLKNNRRNKILYKKFLVLKTNINNDTKIFKFKKKKWDIFKTILKRQKSMKIKLKPFTNYDYIAAKFASQGNSFKKKFRNDLIAKKTFNYFYGNLMKKYLKKRMKTIYNYKESYNYKLVCLKFFESRLDLVLSRSKFCFSVKNAKHLISHKHITVNNTIEKNKSYILNVGDVVRVKPSSFRLVKPNLIKIIQENIKIKKNISSLPLKQLARLTNLFCLLWPIPPKYLIINYKTLEIIFGNIKNFNFSIYFPFKLNIHSIIVNYYRH